METRNPKQQSGLFNPDAGDPAWELRQIYQAAPLGLALLDRDLRYLRINDQLARLHDLPADDHLGKRVSEIIPQLFPAVEETLLHVIQTGEPVTNMEISGRISLNDPAKGYWLINLHPQLAPGGSVEGIHVIVQDITARKLMEKELQSRLHEIMELKARIERENRFLEEEFKLLHAHLEIVGQSKVIQRVFKQIEQVAPTESVVMITGETGTGKELVARAIHTLSPRKDRLMVTVNCAALSPTLIESELFGREKGAYTGALTRQIGRFEIADGSTIFLDEIGELSLDLQAKLLRVLQEGEFERLGSPKAIRINVRVIAATNRDLAAEVLQGNFRKDLYYRLNIFPIDVPPLRERVDDIPLLVWSFIGELNLKMGKAINIVSQRTMDKLKNYSWPGNVRELRNAIERAMILSRGDHLEIQLPADDDAEELSSITLEEAEHQHILDALKKTMWRIKGPQGAAKLLGIKAPTLYARMKKLGIPYRAQKTE